MWTLVNSVIVTALLHCIIIALLQVNKLIYYFGIPK